MLRLYIAATGSQANTYVLTGDGGESLILDAGIALRKVLPHIPNIRKICGCCITHEHADHARAWKDYACRGIPVYTSAGTKELLPINRNDESLYTARMHVARLQSMQVARRGAFKIMAFDVEHDAAEPLGFLIQYIPTGETLVYATDTYYLRYTFPGVNYWLIECNYIEDMITSDTDAVLLNRLKESHMSLRRLKDALSANDLTDTAKIVLIHLSDSRSDEKRMVSEVEKLTGIDTIAAAQDKEIILSRTPF